MEQGTPLSKSSSGSINEQPGHVESHDAFVKFYDKYRKACFDKDSTFLRSILPAGIPADQFSFVLNMSHESALAIEASGIKPVFKQTGNRMDVIYDGDLGDGMTNFVSDFYLHNDEWLKYDPSE